MPIVSDQEFWDFRKKLNHPLGDDISFTYLASVAPNLDVSSLKLAARFTHNGTGDFHRVRVLAEGYEGGLRVEFIDYGSKRSDIRLEDLRSIRDNLGDLPPSFLVKYTCDDITLTAPLQEVRAAVRPYLKNVHFEFTAPNKASDVKIELEKDSETFIGLKEHLVEYNVAE